VSFLSLGREPRFKSGGTPRTFEDAEREENERHNEEVRAARIEVARRNWTEIDPPERLFRRGFGWLVDDETDYVFIPRRGTTFETGRASLMTGEGLDLWFFIDRDSGDVVPLERLGTETWSEIVAKRARKQAARQ
jgi:hypothetical protein